MSNTPGFGLDDILAIVKPHHDKLIAEGRANKLERENDRLQRRLEAFDDMLAALRTAERAIDDCQNYRSHLHHTELAEVRAAIDKAEGVTS